MPDLILSWGDVPASGGGTGGYGTQLTAPTTIPTGGTGGVEVTVVSNIQQEGATAFTVNQPNFDVPAEGIPEQSALKLFSDGIAPAGLSDTMTTSLIFASNDPLYQDSVTDVSFRLFDIDSGDINDDPSDPTGGSPHTDNVTIRAFDADGNEVPVVISPGSDITVTGNTLQGDPDTDGESTDGPISSLIEIAGPIARIEIDYNNGGTGTQEVLVSDLLLTTIDSGINDDPDAVDDAFATEVDTDITFDVLGNDSDPDGDPLTLTSVTPTLGSVTFTPAGEVVYTPPGGFVGTDTLTYTISDGNGGTDIATVTITVDPDVNDPPVAVDDTASTPFDTLIEDIDVIGNDTDPDGDTLSLVPGSATTADGTVTENPDGTLNFDPTPGFVGPATITYTVTDGVETDTGTLTVNVAPDGGNSVPVAADDTASTPFDTLIEDIDVIGNDTDPDGDTLSLVPGSATSPDGTVTENPDGTLNFDPTPGFEGPATITYTVTDGTDTDTGTLTVTVAPDGGNTPPVAVDDFGTTPFETPLENIDIIGNDTDVDGDTLSLLGGSASSPDGDVSQNPDGTINFEPAIGFVGDAIITYTVVDGNGGEDTGTLTVTVTGTNAAPVAEDDTATTPFDTLIEDIDVLGNDTDADGDTLSLVPGSATSPDGVVTENPDGTLDFDPTPGFTGPATVTYTVTDGTDTDTGTLTITVEAPVNNDPTPADDIATTPVDTLLEDLDVLGNDSDPDGDPLTVTSATAPNGTVTINPDGTLDYQPDPGFSGTDTITYVVDDGNGGTAPADVVVTVGSNDPPVAVDDAAETTPVDTAITGIDVLSNDSDPDGDPLTVTAATAPNGTVTVNPDGTLDYLPDVGFIGSDTITYTITDSISGTDTAELVVTVTDPATPNQDPDAIFDAVNATTDEPLENIDVLGNDSDPDGDPLTVTSATALTGTVTINPDGTLDYLSAPGFRGTDLITYEISDGQGGTDTTQVRVSVREGPANDDPVAVDDVAATPVDTLLEDIDVLGNDSDPEGDPLTVTAATAPNGTVTINPDGTLDYQPDPGFSGPDTITYTIDDGEGGTDTGIVSVTVGTPPANDPPVAVDDASQSTPVDTLLEDIDVLGNDSDPDGDPLTVTAATAPNGTVTINPDGTLDYQPDPGFTGTDTITYTITDGISGSDTATVPVTVGTPTNLPPEPNNDIASTPLDTLLEDLDVLGNDSDPDGDPLTVISATAPNGTVTINPDGTLDYDPTPGFEGTDIITYVVDDGNGNTAPAEVIVTVGTAPDNSAPIAVDDADETTPVDTLLENIDVLGNDSDPDGDLIEVIDASAPNGTVTINPDGTLDYQPDPGFEGEDTITYQITDNISGNDTAELTVLVGAPNTDPDADPDTTSTDPITPVTIFPLGNDTDPEGDPLTITSATVDPAEGTVTILPGDTSVEFTPAPGFEDDVATITYTISDGNGGEDTTTIQVLVGTPPLDGIVEGTGAGEYIGEDDPTTGPVDPYLGDPDGDQVDNDDAIEPEAGSNDDVIQAGGGDDTVEAGEGNDNVDGGDGDDIIDAGEGDDFVLGDGFGDPGTVNGNDSIDTGDGDDTVFADDFASPSPGGDDTVTTGDGNDSVGAGGGDDVIDTSGTIPLIDNSPFPSFPEDDDPEDDRDFVDAGEGNDLIITGDDADTIIAGEGDDTIISGIDDDSIVGDGGNDLIDDVHGADTVDGGDGDDTINVGVDSFTDYVGDDPNLPITDSGITFVTDPDTDDGRDLVFGGAGNDVINTGDDADTIDGGDDDDTINSGIDDDRVLGGSGDDSILGGHGSDTIFGQNGDDFIDAGHTGTITDFEDEPDATEPVGLDENDRDSIEGGAGNDTIIGGDDDDTIRGGSGADEIDGGIDEDLIFGDTGNDIIDGGDGDDTIDGGFGGDSIDGGDGDDSIIGNSGDDTVTGGEGADSISTGAGQDSIVGATADDTVDGGSTGPVDFDVLDLRGAGEAENAGGRITIDYDAPGSEGGVVNFLDAGDVVTGTMRFDEIENVIPCFTPGTLIATPTGERKVEDLQVGDRVITRDNGIQEIRWCGAKDMTGAQLAANDHMQPVLIQAGALGDNLPERDILVSPQHRMLLTTDQAAMYFEEREVLVAAKHLTILDGVDRVESSGTTYIHIMFEQHEVVLSNGTWSESFQPGDYTLDGIGKEQRDEILELFPELATQVGTEAYQSARRTLKKYEAALLLG